LQVEKQLIKGQPWHKQIAETLDVIGHSTFQHLKDRRCRRCFKPKQQQQT